jgi:hypothetical protein
VSTIEAIRENFALPQHAICDRPQLTNINYPSNFSVPAQIDHYHNLNCGGDLRSQEITISVPLCSREKQLQTRHGIV